jgi:serine/threonine protein kinase
MYIKKTINSNPVLKRLLNTEVSIMNKIIHPNVMHLYDYLETDNNFYLVIKYCNKGDLCSYFKKYKIKFLKESEAIKVMKQIMNGFVELRKYNVMHRDLKLSNLFLDDETVVIGDFGFAKTGKEMTGTTLGTPLSMAPEMIKGESKYNSKTDLWGIGIIFYQLLFGEPPFFGLSLGELLGDIEKNAGKNLRFPKKIKVSDESKYLLIKLLEIDPNKRLSWKDFFTNKVFEMTIRSEKDLQSGNEPQTSNRTLEEIEKDTDTNKESYLICKKSNYLLEEEFENNYNEQKNLPDSKKLEYENFLYLSNSLKPYKISKNSNAFDSTIMFEEIINKMKDKEIIMENFYRYCHEINKLNFNLNTVKRVLNFFLNYKDFSKNSCFLIMAVISILKLTKVLTSEFYESLLVRKNSFNLNQFKEFSNSRKYELLIDLFSQNLTKISLMIKKMINNSTIYNFLDENKLIDILHESFSEKDSTILLKRSLENIYRIFFKTNHQLTNNRDFLLIYTFMLLSLKSQQLFPYWIETKKFRWDNFALNYKNMNNHKLLEIIKFSQDEL